MLSLSIAYELCFRLKDDLFERPPPPSPAPFITPGSPPGRLSGTSGFPGDFELKSY
jgi:hypothetical protein